MEASSIEIDETVPASRKLQADDAAGLLQGINRLVVMKGKKVTEFDKPAGQEDAVAGMLGPTGNLRAPTIRSGKTMLVGFNEDVFTEMFGS